MIKCGVMGPAFPGWSTQELPNPAPGLPSLLCHQLTAGTSTKRPFMPHFLNLHNGQGWLSQSLHYPAN